jgi:hypothetical protein
VGRNTRDAVVVKTGDQAHVSALLIAPRKRRPHSIANAAADPVERRQISLVVARQILWSFENLKGNRNPEGFERRTSAAEAVKHRRFSARLNPCPSYIDALSFSLLVVAWRSTIWGRGQPSHASGKQASAKDGLDLAADLSCDPDPYFPGAERANAM